MKENLTLQKAQVCDSRDPSLFTRSAYGIVFIIFFIYLIQISASNAASTYLGINPPTLLMGKFRIDFLM